MEKITYCMKFNIEENETGSGNQMKNEKCIYDSL